MSDTITCPNCSATLPSAAAFCTTCGTRVAPAAPPAAASAPPPPAAPPTAPPPPMPGPATFTPPADPTRVDGPPPGDPTQVIGAAPPPPPASAAAPSAPWQPADAASTSAWSPTTEPAAPAYGTPPPAAAPTAQVPAWSPSNWEGAAAPAATATAAPAKRAGSPLGAGLAILGAILTLVGIFMPWVESNLSSNGLSGWDLTSGDKGFRLPDGALLTFESLDPYALLAIGVIALGVGALALQAKTRNLSRVLAVVLGAAVIGYMVRDWTSLADVVKEQAPASFEVSSAVGFYLVLAGGALVILSALMPSQSSKGSPSPAS